MPEFDDVISPAHYRPQLDYSPVSAVERYTVLLKDGETTATIYPIQSPSELPPGLLAFLCDEFNMEVERGDTFAFFDTLHIDAFQNYWFGAFAGVMVLGDAPTLEGPKQWEKYCLGTFFIKPNYPGRASHVCTAGFLVNAGIRGKGIGRTLTDCFLQWAPRLGYTYCVFNLVFETNVPARRIWESLNFKRIGRVKSAGILKGHDTAVDAIIYGRELVTVSDSSMGAYRFDRIRFYLETGKYPAMSDRSEKSRLRSSASHYRIEDGKLKLRDREVVSDPVRQLQICTELHMANHGGINKTTAAVTEKYHWTRIKDTVSAAIKNCVTCSESAKEEVHMKRPKRTERPPAAKPSRPNVRQNDDMLHLTGRGDLLPHDLGLDDGLMAVVEAAQKRQPPRRDHSSPPTYAAVAAGAVGNHANQFYSGDYHYKERNGREHVPVDPDVSVFDHNSGGDEIEIARALVHNDDEQERRKDTNGDVANMFFKND
ncbi:putative l-azetidine-2-carboxylic acid acetyltransferase [Clavispora lusitaniae]|uniref:L-azetidine-2-carboxylic acid acetyltransferase n=1 Tax=Clavispora lusitaniae TaxID=36911 RepID=A0AA91T170_CLALS|nr:putative l-azetidine-2-carboxylic acid acetyltransferase [Clavispora lusitaniae]